ncbi:aminodeoxychorismate synthase component I [Rhodococcus spelaei]|uniref:aminodeoxychorismate synthase n=1 Tax=Rhodococcus spelaei TaxID=2546320 RepID=A0A541B7M2_9NOCA|nr:aminodeoxychorismate synthase component I [Rhodococcus spelaei]TQF68327.1 aminodeoxychorismate synthase component I [Rhodococcus spelaei]
MRTLLIDNYDSFTYNLYSLLTEVNGREPVVVANDVDWGTVRRSEYDNIVVSPGPGRPERRRDFGISSNAVTESGLPVLGVCLGHQGLCYLFGGRVSGAPEPMHGRICSVQHTGRDLFAGIPSPFRAVRYHSLAVDELSPDLEAEAWADDGVLMAVRHRELPLWGVQFHPESICTDYGRELLTNFRDLTPPRSRMPRVDAPAPPPATPEPGHRYRVRSVTVDRAVDPRAVYERLFAGGPNSFWLDGSSASDAQSKFSVMGDSSGPRAEFVTYRVAETTVRVHRDGHPTTELSTTLFDYLDEQLRTRAVAPRLDLPFAFTLGYVGYLGYELKADTCGQLVHASARADAAVVFADRALVVDHSVGCCHLLVLDDGTDEPEGDRWLRETSDAIRTLDEVPDQSPPAPPLVPAEADIDIRFRHDRATYLGLIDQCLGEIRSGETYEVCLTNVASVNRTVDPLEGFSCLREISPTPYNALLRFAGISVLSASPERFLRIGGDRTVESKPIKGTRPRASEPGEDEELRRGLLLSEKDRAENLMIVDLVRNDLSRVCVPGSVHVPRLFDVETYAPVHQLVSTVRGTLRADATAVDCLRATFPGGSMTGAPKVRTMEIIDKLEDGPRGVYSGAIGYLSLTGTADFSIVIRTMVAAENEVTFGVGGAIVALSDADDEFEETMVKALTMRRCLSVADEPSGDDALPDISESDRPGGRSRP